MIAIQPQHQIHRKLQLLRDQQQFIQIPAHNLLFVPILLQHPMALDQEIAAQLTSMHRNLGWTNGVSQIVHSDIAHQHIVYVEVHQLIIQQFPRLQQQLHALQSPQLEQLPPQQKTILVQKDADQQIHMLLNQGWKNGV